MHVDSAAGPLVIIDGHGPFAEHLERTLLVVGARVLRPGTAPGPDGSAGPRWDDDRPEAVVLGPGEDGWGAARRWWRRGIPHLPVMAGGRRAAIGPLVVPGRGACLWCVALTERESGRRTHPWPGDGRGHLTPQTLDVTAAVLASAVAGAVLASLWRGGAALVGVSTAIDVTLPSVSHEFWAPHPACSCHLARVTMAT